MHLSDTKAGAPSAMDLDPAPPDAPKAGVPSAVDVDPTTPEAEAKATRSLGEAQQSLAGIANGRLVVVPGDGACFFHVVARGTSSSKTIKELRESCECDGDNWAEEKHIDKLTKSEKFRLVVWKIELTAPKITVPCEPYQRRGAKKAKETVHTIYWTRQGKGIHFDLWTPTGGQTKGSVPVRKDQNGGDGGGSSSKGPGDGCTPGERVFCPIQECPCANSKRAAGWTDLAAMRPHLQEHAHGKLRGDVPKWVLDEGDWGLCRVCAKILSKRFGDACPRCRPSLAFPGKGSGEGRPLPPNYPTMEQVFRSKISTRKFVPTGAKALWAEIFSKSLAQIRSSNDELAWVEFCMMAKCLLRVPRERGGKKNKGKGEQDTKARCRRWLEGEKAELWKEALDTKGCPAAAADSQKDKVEHGGEAWEEQVMELLRAGHLGKAAGVIVSEPPVAVTPAVVAEMRAKHPPARAEDEAATRELRKVDASTACRVDHVEILKLVKTFPKASAGGPSELKPQHVLDAFVHNWQGEVGRNLAAVVNMMLRGDCPESVRPWVMGAKLAALPKQAGGLRPIAVGETLRRIAGKAMMHCASDAVNQRLKPFQVGVGVKAGAEVLVHVARQWLGRNKGERNKVLVMLDLENAFNSIDRSAIRQGIRRTFPGAASWIDCCYAEDSWVILGEELLSSGRGVQQGDPAGPAIFALGIHEDVEEAMEATEQAFPGELDWVGLFLDDTMAAGTARAVKMFVETLATKWKCKGLELAPSKSIVVPSGGHHTDLRPEDFPGMVWNEDGNFKLLGAPFGSRIECEAQMAKRVLKAEEVAKGAAQLSSSQGGLLLVRHCGGFAKVAYVCRTTPPSLVKDALVSFSDVLRNHVGRVAQRSLEQREWDLAGLAIKSGGLGVRHPDEHAEAAYLASWMAAREAAREIDRAFDPADTDGSSHIKETKAAFNEGVGQEDSLGEEIDMERMAQKNLSGRRDKRARERLDAASLDDPYFRAHLRLAAIPGAGAWLTAMPEEDAREMDSVLFRIALQRRLRMRVTEQDEACMACGGVMDTWGDHALVCPCQGDRTRRHNILRDLLAVEAARGSLGPEKEKAGLLPHRPPEDGIGSGENRQEGNNEARRPADVWLPRGAGFSGGRPEALDFAVTSGMRRDRLCRTLNSAESICEDYAETKRQYKDTDQQVTEAGMKFTPIVFEAHAGGWGLAARQIIGSIAKHQEVAGRWFREGASLVIAQRVSMSLQRECARAVLRRLAPPEDRQEHDGCYQGRAGEEEWDWEENREVGDGGGSDGEDEGTMGWSSQ
jgi:hypothetical protein